LKKDVKHPDASCRKNQQTGLSNVLMGKNGSKRVCRLEVSWRKEKRTSDRGWNKIRSPLSTLPVKWVDLRPEAEGEKGHIGDQEEK